MNNLHDTLLFDCVHATCNTPVFNVMNPKENRSQALLFISMRIKKVFSTQRVSM